jgi:Patatin-like phospholipase
MKRQIAYIPSCVSKNGHNLEADMTGKITSGVISRRMALSVLGSPLALGFAAAASNAEAESAAVPGRSKLALALQGGGLHGAFTWGVLDRFLDYATIDIIGVTGTSAGAMNSAVLVNGLVRGGRNQARAELRQYWQTIGAMHGVGGFFSGVPGRRLPLRLSKAFRHTSRASRKTCRPAIGPRPMTIRCGRCLPN